MDEKIKFRVLIPLILWVLILLTSFIFVAFRFHTEHIDRGVWSHVNTTMEQLNRGIELDAQYISGLVDFIEKDQDIQKAYLTKDRKRLLAITLPIFQRIRSQHQVTHFYFHNLDQTNYLRVHNPSRSGDLINRITMAKAVANQKTVHGIELGPLGTFTLRVVRPWVIDGKLVGFLELGEEIEHVIARFRDQQKMDYLFLIDKEFIDKKIWENGQKMMGRNENWTDFNEMAIIFRTFDIPNVFVKTQLAKYGSGKKSFLFNSKINGQKYRSGFTPLVDAGERTVGVVISFYNTTTELQKLKKFIFRSVLMSVPPAVIFILFFWYYLGRIERKILSSRYKLFEEQKRRECATKSLAVSEKKYRSIINNLQDGFCRIDMSTKINMISPSVLDIFGYDTEEEILGSNFKEHFADPDDCRIFFKKLQEVENCLKKYELTLKRKNGSIFPAMVISSAAYYGEDGKQAGVEGIFSDISEQKKIESELIQARKLESVGQLAAGIAHEINTPAQFVGTNIEFLKEANADIFKLIGSYQELLEKSRHTSLSQSDINQIETLQDEIDLDYYQDEMPVAIEQSQEGVRRISEIVLAMKEFSHPANKDKVPNNLNKLIETTVTIASNEWKHVANLQLDLAPDLPMVDCFAGEMSQVFLNIIVNAAHAIADKKSDKDKEFIKIGSSFSGNWVEIKISDTGSGIPDSIRHRIFDPFFTTKTVGKGTGQGLSIAYDTVTVKHGGEIFFESVMNEGTSFIIRLACMK